MEGLFSLLFGVVAIWFVLWLWILLPARMAEARGRSAVAWVLLSFIFSPFFSIFFLFLLGDAGKRNA